MKTPGWFNSLSSLLVAGLLSVSVMGCDGLDGAEGSVDGETTSTSSPLASAVPGAALVNTATASASTSTKTAVDPLITSTRTLERYNPWVVQVVDPSGLTCKGTVIHKSWVLTAAHCLYSKRVEVKAFRTDPLTGVTKTFTRANNALAAEQGVFVHPSYQHTGFRYDIALVQLATPFGPEGEADEAAAADAWGRVMTAALPRASLPVGRPATIVKNRGMEPAGYTPIVTAAPDFPAEAGQFHLYPAAGSVCKGDSGSGVFEIVNGRATVVGVASTAVVDSQTDCLRAEGEVGVTDVFSYRSWIYATMGMTADQVDGQVRLRWSGASSAPGYMSLQCQSAPMTPVEAPMNVPGSELSMDCAKVRVYCAPEGSNRVLSSFTAGQFTSSGGVTGVAAFPFLSTVASTFGLPGYRFECGVVDNTKPAQVGGGGTLSISSTR